MKKLWNRFRRGAASVLGSAACVLMIAGIVIGIAGLDLATWIDDQAETLL
ncbi:MAG TPA: hypothetical protein VFI41_12680 [Gemmatimonadales bacterium]|nr:hypothetical protein [Gemmatimonadales bacterium]